MASHLQATAGSITRAQQKTLPAGHVHSPVDEFAQSVVSGVNAAVASGIALPAGCGMLAAVQPNGSSLHALLRAEQLQLQQQQHKQQQQEQQPSARPEENPESAAARMTLASPACSSGETTTERTRSWYGQRSWTRVSGAPPPSSSGTSQPAATATGASQAAADDGTDAAPSASTSTASPSPGQAQAWKFSVMCYNILADTYAQYFAPKLYRDVPRPYLDWHHRLKLLVEEIRYWGPDVVCLQEVQHYHELEPEMRAAGYEGRFMRRTGRRRDGCATFWRVDRLRVCALQRLDFAPLGLEDNVAMLLSLTPRCEAAGAAGALDSQTAEALRSVRLLVATTHITFDPAKGDVKLGQVRTLISQAAELAAHPPLEEPQVPHGHGHGDVHGHNQQQQQQQRNHQHERSSPGGHINENSNNATNGSGGGAGGRHSHDGNFHRHRQQEHPYHHQQQQQQHHPNQLQNHQGLRQTQSHASIHDQQPHPRAIPMPGGHAGAGAGAGAAARPAAAVTDPTGTADASFSFPPPPPASLLSTTPPSSWAPSETVEGRWRKPRLAPRVSNASGESSVGTESGATSRAASTCDLAAGAAAELQSGPHQHQYQHQQGSEQQTQYTHNYHPQSQQHPQQHHHQQQQQQQQAPQQGGAPPSCRPPRPLQTLTIITGDFNSTAGSPLYQFVARGALDLSKTNRKKLSGQLHGVCHTQYKPVSEVKQLHAQLTVANAVVADPTGGAAAATAATGGVSAASAGAAAATPFAADTRAADGKAPAGGTAMPTVTAVCASAPGTPPSTPAMSRLASAAIDTAAAAISACTAKAVAAISHPALTTPAAKAAAATQVLDGFLSSTPLRLSGAERWSEKELRSAMGDQYDSAVVQGLDGVGGAFAPARVLSHPHLPLAGQQPQQPQQPPSQQHQQPIMSSRASAPQLGLIGAGCDSGGGASDEAVRAAAQQAPKLGRQQHPPAVVNRLSSGAPAAAAPAAAAASSGSRRSLDLVAATADREAAPGAAAQGGAAPDAAGGPLVVRHPLALKSSYVEVARAEPSFTSIHSGFMGTVDFIWYTSDAILQHQQQQQQQQHPQQWQQQQQAQGHQKAQQHTQAWAQVQEQHAETQACDGGADVPVSAQAAQPPPPRLRAQGCDDAGGSYAAASSTSAAAAAAATGSGSGDAAAPVRRFQLVPVAVLQPPDLELLPHGLPAEGWGSDHISVMTEFELRLV